MDKEGQSPNSAGVFHSANIGDKATPEYFSNIEGGNKDSGKVQRRMTHQARKILIIILSAVAAITLVVTLIFIIINVTGKKVGSRTHEELPTAIDDIELRTYGVVYQQDNGGYAEALTYLANLIMDLHDSEVDDNLVFAARAFFAQLVYEAGGGSQLGIQEALKLLDQAQTEREKYTIYMTLSRLYTWENNMGLGNYYEDLANELDVPENKVETRGANEDGNNFVIEDSEESAAAAQRAEEARNAANTEAEGGDDEE